MRSSYILYAGGGVEKLLKLTPSDLTSASLSPILAAKSSKAKSITPTTTTSIPSLVKTRVEVKESTTGNETLQENQVETIAESSTTDMELDVEPEEEDVTQLPVEDTIKENSTAEPEIDGELAAIEEEEEQRDSVGGPQIDTETTKLDLSSGKGSSAASSSSHISDEQVKGGVTDDALQEYLNMF